MNSSTSPRERPAFLFLYSSKWYPSSERGFEGAQAGLGLGNIASSATEIPPTIQLPVQSTLAPKCSNTVVPIDGASIIEMLIIADCMLPYSPPRPDGARSLK